MSIFRDPPKPKLPWVLLDDEWGNDKYQLFQGTYFEAMEEAKSQAKSKHTTVTIFKCTEMAVFEYSASLKLREVAK